MIDLKYKIEESLLDDDLDTKRDININMAIIDKFKKTCIDTKQEPLEIGDVVLCDWVGTPTIGVIWDIWDGSMDKYYAVYIYADDLKHWSKFDSKKRCRYRRSMLTKLDKNALKLLNMLEL